MRYQTRVTRLSIALLGLASAAHADDALYVAGSVGRSEVRFDSTNLNASGNNTGFQVGLGYRPFGVLGAELDYVDFPRAYSGINYVDSYGLGVSLLGFLPIAVVDIYGRLGLFSARTDAHMPNLSFDHTGSDLTYGAGVGAHWGRIGVRAEFDAFNVQHARTMNLASVGVIWSFF